MTPQFNIHDRKKVGLRPQGRWCVYVVALLTFVLIGLPGGDADAQGRRGRKASRSRKARKAKRKAHKKGRPSKPDDASPTTRGARGEAETIESAGPDAGELREGPEAPEQSDLANPGEAKDGDAGDPRDKGAKVRTRGPKDRQTQVFDFTGLNLAGSERKPQLLYFLDRAQAELKRASLERRSFIPEMVRSLDEEAL